MNRETFRICVLSYQGVHRKTIDTLCQLRLAGYKNVCVYAQPFHYKKTFKPIYEHRPNLINTNNIRKTGYEKAIKNLGYDVVAISSTDEIFESPGNVFLVCGAGLLPPAFLEKYRVINAHPGYIPNERGLDALKWAIVENQPIGGSTHFLGQYIDAGQVIERKIVPVYPSDTFHAVAQRQYEIEIDMLISALQKWDRPQFFTDGQKYVIHKRMPNETEKNLMEIFERYKRNWCNLQLEASDYAIP